MENKPENKRKTAIRKLKNKFRLLIINDDTYEEQFSMRLSILNIITVIGVSILIVMFFVGGILSFTPLREYIPGYSNLETKILATEAYRKADSLDAELAIRDVYLTNLKRILSGEINADSIMDVPLEELRVQGIIDVKTREDSIMRQKVEGQEQYALHGSSTDLKDKVHFFFTPLKGTVTDHFDRSKSHFGTDIVTSKGATINAVMNGTIVLADFTSNSGYVVQIQHHNNLVSIYKHCSSVLKEAGDLVEAGDPIAVVGNTGELSTGPHLHFEIWEDGKPIDPEKYIVF